jgi:hypothetical protein
MKQPEIYFLNRDHIVSVTICHGEIIVTTTGGSKIRIPASPSMIAQFSDELANSVQSNFVSINQFSPKNRFVDAGPEFVTIVKANRE